jgi:regulator of protease activity HflC (stomatin/prohibitin superfamily)
MLNRITGNHKYMFWILLIVLLLLMPSILFVVRGKTAAILETFGRPHKTAVFPGLHVKLPWPITSIVARVNLQIQEIHSDVSVKTSDNAFMTLPVKVQYRASDDGVGAVKAHYELEAPEKQITSYVLNNVRQTASGMEMTDLYANRDNVEQQVQEALSEQFARFGYIIENVLVDEPQPSPEVRDAFNQVIASKRLMEAARNEAEAQRIKLVGAAQAEAESKKLQGEGMAQMREAIARGLEEAMRTMQNAGLTTDQSIQLLSDTNRLDTITSAAAHGNTIILDAGANKDLAGMAALLESVQQKGK